MKNHYILAFLLLNFLSFSIFSQNINLKELNDASIWTHDYNFEVNASSEGRDIIRDQDKINSYRESDDLVVGEGDRVITTSLQTHLIFIFTAQIDDKKGNRHKYIFKSVLSGSKEFAYVRCFHLNKESGEMLHECIVGVEGLDEGDEGIVKQYTHVSISQEIDEETSIELYKLEGESLEEAKFNYADGRKLKSNKDEFLLEILQTINTRYEQDLKIEEEKMKEKIKEQQEILKKKAKTSRM